MRLSEHGIRLANQFLKPTDTGVRARPVFVDAASPTGRMFFRRRDLFQGVPQTANQLELRGLLLGDDFGVLFRGWDAIAAVHVVNELRNHVRRALLGNWFIGVYELLHHSL